MASGAGGGAAAELQQDVQGDAGGELAPEIADAEEGMGGDLASNPWVNPNSLNGPGDPEGTA
jgi:hypothetical protein